MSGSVLWGYEATDALKPPQEPVSPNSQESRNNLGKVTLTTEFKRRSRVVQHTPPNYSLFVVSVTGVSVKGWPRAEENQAGNLVFKGPVS